MSLSDGRITINSTKRMPSRHTYYGMVWNLIQALDWIQKMNIYHHKQNMKGTNDIWFTKDKLIFCDLGMRAIQKVNNVCAYSPRTCFVAADHWFLVFSVMLKISSCSCTLELSRGKCRDSCGHGCADWESRRLWDARCYLFSADRWDLRLSCPREVKSRMELLFCSTSAYCPADTSLAAWAIPLGNLRASSVLSGPGTIRLLPVSKNEGAPCW